MSAAPAAATATPPFQSARTLIKVCVGCWGAVAAWYPAGFGRASQARNALRKLGVTSPRVYDVLQAWCRPVFRNSTLWIRVRSLCVHGVSPRYRGRQRGAGGCRRRAFGSAFGVACALRLSNTIHTIHQCRKGCAHSCVVWRLRCLPSFGRRGRRWLQQPKDGARPRRLLLPAALALQSQQHRSQLWDMATLVEQKAQETRCSRYPFTEQERHMGGLRGGKAASHSCHSITPSGAPGMLQGRRPLGTG
jgi:hypothetical protein